VRDRVEFTVAELEYRLSTTDDVDKRIRSVESSVYSVNPLYYSIPEKYLRLNLPGFKNLAGFDAKIFF
jgi:hypothetical protein